MQKRKFVYSDKAPGDDEFLANSDSGTDSEEGVDLNDIADLEKDLAALDTDQADFIRKINRYGAMSFTAKIGDHNRNTF